MSTTKRDTAPLKNRLHDIQSLEEQLIQMKRQLLLSGSPASGSGESGNGVTGYLMMRNRDRHFAIPVDHVEEVVEIVAVRSPQTQPGVIGLIDYHGELIAALDLGELAGMGKTPTDPDHVMVICLVGNIRFAVMVPEAIDVIAVDSRQIKAAEEVMPGLLRELGLLRTSDFTASIIDIWSTILSVQVDAPSDTPARGNNPDTGGERTS